MGVERVLVVADIEGSSGCWSYRASSFMTPEWRRACVDMTLDVAAVVEALYGAGAVQVQVHDFHRTGYNLLPERIDPRARVVCGYRRGPVKGIGTPAGSEAALFLGMHAASGTPGFLAHTLTSRLSSVEVNGHRLPEVALFSATLAPFGIRPVFFSGCPEACRQAEAVAPGIQVYSIPKTAGPKAFDPVAWRQGLAAAAARSLANEKVKPFDPPGPFHAVITLRDGAPAARRLGRRWRIEYHGPRLFFCAPDLRQLYHILIRLCYLTPFAERTLPAGLWLYRLIGLAGRAWVRRGTGRAFESFAKADSTGLADNRRSADRSFPGGVSCN